MTNEDKKRIAEYMGWITVKVGTAQKPYLIYVDGKDCNIHHDNFNSNDAGLCVQEMQKRGDDYVKFIKHAYDMAFDDGKMQFHTVTAWLFNAENFFNAMSEWLKERE